MDRSRPHEPAAGFTLIEVAVVVVIIGALMTLGLSSRLPCDAALALDRKLDNVTPDNKPFSQGAVTARNAANAAIESCVTGAANDPVETLLIRY